MTDIKMDFIYLKDAIDEAKRMSMAVINILDDKPTYTEARNMACDLFIYLSVVLKNVEEKQIL